MRENSRRILGIDPGTCHVGYAVLEQEGTRLVRVASGEISGGTGELAERLVRIYQGLVEVLERWTPAEAAVETVFTSKNPKTAIAIGEARGVVLLAAAQKGLRIYGYEPALVKRTVTGSGRAGKEQVGNMVEALLGLSSSGCASDHETDALAIGITHALRCRFGEAGGAGVPPRRGRARRELPEMVRRQLPAEVRRQAGEGPLRWRS
ncbi:MAG: crossover junction endodeoxyribonuclease RuvC [Planctomycetota bacterium]|jgi:crossover junction endodeoxyribonuclease RuvC|nr:crossover junction endodeoxyribonuclease RuvC [Planctomycetota bacterium]